MIKPERQFRQSVIKYVDGLYVWAIHDSYQTGIPDHYYSGKKGDLWVEYKYFPKDKTSFDLTKPESKPVLARTQQEWLGRRYREGRNVWVIVGMPGGGVILVDEDWLKPVEVKQLLSRRELGEAITRFCRG